jgi:type II secretory pathway component PulF
MQDFALYNTLNKDLPSKDLTAANKAELVKSISTLSENAVELVYALIKYHNMNDKKNSDMYNQTRQNVRNATADLSWNLNDLPIKLRNILFRFVQLEERRKDEVVNRMSTQEMMKTKMNSDS